MSDAWQSAWVEVLPDFQNFKRTANTQMTSVLGSAGTAGGIAAGGNIGGGVLGGIKGLGGPIIAAVAALGIGTLVGNAIGSGISYGLDSIDLASDLNESFNAVEVTFGSEIADDLAILAKNAPKALRITQKSFNEYATRFSAFGKTVVGEGGDVVGFLDELTGRGADFASVYNVDVADALGLFQSGLAGETEPLRKYGIDLSAAAVNAFAYANGIGDAGRELTEAEKVQARYGALLEQTSAVQGDAANTSGDLAAQQRDLAVAFEEAQTKLGEALIPVFLDFVTFANDELIPVLNDVLGEVGPEVAAAFKDALPEIKELMTAMADALPAVVELGSVALPAVVDALGSMFSASDVEGATAAIENLQRFSDYMADWKPFQSQEEVEESWQGLFNFFNGVVEKSAEDIEADSDRIKGYWRTTIDQMRADTEGLAAGGHQLGSQFAQGFADGITTNAEASELAAERMALAARNKVVGALGIQSPSRVMRELGAFTSEGFALGIESNLAMVEGAFGSLLPGTSAMSVSMTAGGASHGGGVFTNLSPAAMQSLERLAERQVVIDVEGETLARGTASGSARLAALGAN